MLRSIGDGFKHIGGALLFCLRGMTRAALIVGAVTFVCAELAAALSTHTVIAPAIAQAVILLLCVVVMYGVALTSLIIALVREAHAAVRALEGDVTATAHSAAIIAERADGRLTGWLGWLDSRADDVLIATLGARATGALARRGQRPQQALGVKATQDSAPLVERGVSARRALRDGASANAFVARPSAERRPPLERATAMRQDSATPGGRWVALEDAADDQSTVDTQAEIAATEAFLSTAPRRAVNARPVPAGNLPRIAWAYEHAELSAPTGVGALPPIPLAPRPQAAALSSSTPPPLAPQNVAFAPIRDAEHGLGVLTDPALPRLVAPTPAAITRPLPLDASSQAGDFPVAEAHHGEAKALALGDVESVDVTDIAAAPPAEEFGAAAMSRPRPRVTTPLADQGDARGVWALISRALVGSRPLADTQRTDAALHEAPTDRREDEDSWLR